MSEPEEDVEAFARSRVGLVLRGKYRLDRLLGVGGMAAVYKVTHRNQAQFALKMLHPQLSLQGAIRQRFLREGYAANSVQHPGAVAVVDDDVAEDGSAFLVMELLDGVEVERYWEERGLQLAPLVAAGIVLQLLDVLVAAHARGIVHRDIKPANLFLTRDGTVKVLDFGIARAMDGAASGARATATGVMLGTPAFMPPEQVLGHAADIDGQVDVWSAGATFFTLVSGRHVHEGTTAAELMVRAATAHAPPVASVCPQVPAPLAQVIDRALAFDKASRWPTALAMQEALDAACRAVYGHAPGKMAPSLVIAPLSGPRAGGGSVSGFSPTVASVPPADPAAPAIRGGATGPVRAPVTGTTAGTGARDEGGRSAWIAAGALVVVAGIAAAARLVLTQAAPGAAGDAFASHAPSSSPADPLPGAAASVAPAPPPAAAPSGATSAPLAPPRAAASARPGSAPNSTGPSRAPRPHDNPLDLPFK